MKIKSQITLLFVTIFFIFPVFATSMAAATTANGYMANKENLRSFLKPYHRMQGSQLS